jgi:hypothetical protein
MLFHKNMKQMDKQRRRLTPRLCERDPLFAARKEGCSILSINPLSTEGEERVVERSDGRVSQRVCSPKLNYSGTSSGTIL